MTSSTTAATETGAGTVRRVLQRQILPIDGDTDVYRLYVDPEAAVLDADKYEVGSNRSAQQLNAAQMRQSTSTGVSIHPDQILDRRDKVGFETPQRSWMKTANLDVVTWLDGARHYPYVDVDALRPQLADWLADRPSPLDDGLVWRLLNFSRWVQWMGSRLKH